MRMYCRTFITTLLDYFCRVGGPIFFANVDKFVDQLYGDVLRPSTVQGSTATSSHSSHEATDPNDNTEEDGAPQHCGSSNIRVIVLDCSRVTFVDSMAVAALKKVNTSYRNVGIQLVLSGCDAKMTAVMAAACVVGNTKRHIEMYPTVHDAVVAVSHRQSRGLNRY